MSGTDASLKVFAEDVSVGVPLPLGAYTVTLDAIIAFARQWDPLDFHTDLEAGDSGYFGGIIASGIQTIAIFQRMSVLSHFKTWAMIAGKGIRNLRFSGPVRPGDVLSGQVTVRSVTPDARGRGQLLLDGFLWNQDGDVVLSLVMESLMRMSRTGRSST